MPDLEQGICCKCIEDAYFSEQISLRGEVVFCKECNEDRTKGISIESLGLELEPLLKIRYEIGEEYKAYDGPDDDRGHYEQHGETLSEIVQDVLGKYFECNEDIVEAVMAAENYDAFGGEQAYWSEDACYEPSRVELGPEDLNSWHSTKAELMHGRRFFSPAARKLFAELFSNIDDIKSWHGGIVEPVCYELPCRTKLYRARVVDSSDAQQRVSKEPAEQVGPPPSSEARSGRMNPEGVSVLYASTKRRTCIAEMRPAIGSTLAVIKLRTSRKLRVLDFCRLERALGNVSFFDPEYTYKQNRLRSLRQLHSLVSKPVLPGKEAEYLITQTMAEYLAHVCDTPFDGIMFRSAQHKAGVNVALFTRDGPFDGRMSRRFGVRYVRKSLEFIRLSSVVVSWDKLEQRTNEGVLYLLDENGVREYDDWH